MTGLEALRAGHGHHMAARFDEAETLYRQALAAPDCPAAAHRLIALFLIERGEAHAAAGNLAGARMRYREALAIDPSLANGWLRLADVLSKFGRMAEAIEALRRAVALDPDLAGGYRALAAAGQDFDTNHVEALLNRANLPAAEQVDLGFALATRFDRLGRFDKAFGYLDRANSILRQSLAAAGNGFDAAALRQYVDAIIADYDSGLFDRAAECGVASEMPVFVVGMPRSGTTLVEQILASHAQVSGVGEGNFIGALVETTPVHDSPRENATCRASADNHIAWLGARGAGAARVVDKTPDNLFHLGMIAMLFPRARIIVCRRDPRDISLSCYFQAFEHAMPFANDLVACVQRITETNRLISYWDSMLTLRMLTVDYEAIIADPTTQSRRMIAFLGLDWDPACLSFHRTPRVVESASVWQVRTPLYASSAGRWLHYRQHLEPVLRVFGRD